MDYTSSQDPEHKDIKVLVAQYEEALANNRQPLIDQDAIDQIVGYYEHSGHYDKALQIINTALSQHPYSGLVLLKKAQLLFDLKICEESMDCLDKAEVFIPGDIGLSLLRSEILTFQSQYMEALHILDEAMECADKEEKSDVWLHMADVYEDWEKYSEVFTCLKECLLNDGTNEEALSRINYCMEITDQFEEGIVLHKKIINANPYSYWAWYNLSFAYASLDLYELAIDALKYVLAIDEDVTYAYRDLAQYYHELTEYKNALEEIEKYAALVKPDADLYLLEGKCYFELKDLRKSRYCFQKAIRTNSSLHEAHYNLGMTYILDEKWEPAFQNLKKATEISPENFEYLDRLAEVALQVEKHEEVKFAFTRAIRLNPENQQIYITMALSFLFDNEVDQAIVTLQEGIEAVKDDTELRYVKAALMLLSNQRKAALLEMEHLLTDHPKKHDVMFRYFPFLKEDHGVLSLLDRFDL